MECWILEKVLKKSWNLPREIKSRKMVKSPVFFFLSYNILSLYKWIFFVLFKSYSVSASYVCCVSWKKLCFAFLKVYIDHLFDKLESGKINKLFWKKVWKKSWMSDPKICTNPVQVNAPQVQDQHSLNWFWDYNEFLESFITTLQLYSV